MAKGYQCLTCGRFAETNARRRCDQGHGGTHEWAPLEPPTELQRARGRGGPGGSSVGSVARQRGAPCRGRGPRKLLERTHILRRCAVQAELGL